MRQEHGFTLIEMMVGIGLMALLLSMAVPALQMFSNNARQTGAVNDFVSSMHAARSTAITTNSRVTVCPSITGLGCAAVSWDQGWIVFTDPNSDQIFDVGETSFHMAEGELWEINNRREHAVANNSDSDRIHLILDYVIAGEKIRDTKGFVTC